MMFCAFLAIDLHHGRRMRLADFIDKHVDQILAEWVAFAATSGPAGEAMELAALQDHARSMLDVIAKDLRSAFNAGLMDPLQATRYRDLVLAPGGTKPAAELVGDFLGRPYGFEAFRAWLAPRPPA